MPLLGWYLGAQLGAVVEAWDHWIAFTLLVALGLKLLWEARTGDSDPQRPPGDPFGLRVMTLLAIATSIDALAVGVTLPMLGAPLAPTIATIGLTTALLSALGLIAGRHFGARLGKRLDVAGGLVLIALGTKILIEHLHA
jgi:putative Mn2+ efflux pump MntP